MCRLNPYKPKKGNYTNFNCDLPTCDQCLESRRHWRVLSWTNALIRQSKWIYTDFLGNFYNCVNDPRVNLWQQSTAAFQGERAPGCWFGRAQWRWNFIFSCGRVEGRPPEPMSSWGFLNSTEVLFKLIQKINLLKGKPPNNELISSTVTAMHTRIHSQVKTQKKKLSSISVCPLRLEIPSPFNDFHLIPPPFLRLISSSIRIQQWSSCAPKFLRNKFKLSQTYNTNHSIRILEILNSWIILTHLQLHSREKYRPIPRHKFCINSKILNALEHWTAQLHLGKGCGTTNPQTLECHKY